MANATYNAITYLWLMLAIAQLLPMANATYNAITYLWIMLPIAQLPTYGHNERRLAYIDYVHHTATVLLYGRIVL